MLVIPAPPVLFSGPAKRSSAPAWYRGDQCIVSYGDTIAEDLCLDNLTQLEYCNDKHEDQVDDSFICEDCDSVGAKELEVEYHDAKEDEVEYHDVEMEGFNIANESTAWYRGEQCVVSHGDDLAEDQCYDHSTQLEHGTDEFLWDGQFDYPCHEEQVEVDNSDIIWEDANELEVESGFYDEELEVACYYDDEVATCFDAEDVVCYSDAEVADYYYLGNEDCYDY